MFFPGAADHIRILGLAQAAVVAAQGTEKVAVLDVQIVAEDGAAIAQIGAHFEQAVIRPTDQTDPERHHLHIAAGPGGGYRIFAKAAFDLDQAQHQLRIEAGAGGFVMDRAEKIQAVVLFRDVLLEAGRHGGQPFHRLHGGLE